MELAILGIIIDILGLVSTALGWAVQKKVHNDIAGSDKLYISQKIWWVGMILVLIAQPLYLIAITLTKISILGVLGPFSILVSILLARAFLNEEIRLWEYIGMGLFIPGSILTLCSSSLTNHRYNREEFHTLFYSKRSMIYLFTNLFLMVVLWIIWHLILKINPGKGGEDSYEEQIDEMTEEISPPGELKREAILNTDNNVQPNDEDVNIFPEKNNSSGTQSENDSLMKYLFGNPRLRFLPLLVYPYFGPFMSGLAATLARWIAGFASSNPGEGHNSNFDNIEAWIYLVLVPVGGLGAYIIVNKALQHYDTIYVVPLFKIGDLMHHILSGAIFLREFKDYSQTELILFLLGVGIWATGVLLLLYGNDKHERERIEKARLAVDRKKNDIFPSQIELQSHLKPSEK